MCDFDFDSFFKVATLFYFDLGFYLLISLVFVFLTIVEFAWVLLLKEFLERRMQKRKDSDDASKYQQDLENPVKQSKRNVNKVTNLKQRCGDDQETKSNAGQLKVFLMYRSSFLDGLPTTRKIDFSAFVIFNVTFFLINVIYWM